MSILKTIFSSLKWVFGFLRKAEPEIRTAISIANLVTEAIKAISKKQVSPDAALQLVLNVIPDDMKNKVLANLIPVLRKAGVIGEEAVTLEEAIVFAAKRISELKGDITYALALNNLAILLTDVLADGKIDTDDLLHIAKAFHDNREKAQQFIDTDGDGISDEDETAAGTDPTDPRDPR